MCDLPVPTYLPHSNVGIISAGSKGEGTSIFVNWNRAYINKTTPNYNIAYNIYYSTDIDTLFSEYPKYVSISPTNLGVEIDNFTPGDLYYFAVRATQFNPAWANLNFLPDSGDSKIYPEGILLSNISETETSVLSISDIEQFPNFGVVEIGNELIYYANKDNLNNSLNNLTRGFLDTNIRFHNTDGYDGYSLQEPFVRFFKGAEENNFKIHSETNEYNYPNYALTENDGYHYRAKDLVNSDYSESDGDLIDVPAYDFRGWRRLNPADILAGNCVGLYVGGEHYCADGYDGTGRMTRGGSVTDINLGRQELLLEQTANPCVLVRKKFTGIHCNCYTSTKEYPDDRCPTCLGTGFVIGWEQFFNTRRADGRILVRFDATADDVPYQDVGQESTFSPNCWTLPVPTINDRDMIIRFNKYTGQEEFRYEVLNVTRNVLFNEVQGAQKFTVARVRKTDAFYKFNVFSNTATIPTLISTSIGSLSGLILPHTHSITINEGIVNLNQINVVTSYTGANITQYHSHNIVNGIVQESLGHTHTLIL